MTIQSLPSKWRSLYGARQIAVFVALFLCLLVAVGGAIAYQVQTSSSGTGPVVKTYPSTLTATHSYTGASTTVFAASTTLAGLGNPSSTYYAPAIATTTNATELDVSANGCVNKTFRCSNRGTLTITFNKPVTNPVLHLSGMGGNTGGTQSMYHASLNLTSWTATGTPTLTRVGGNTNFTVTGSEIRSTTINGGTNCQVATNAGCGSVRINGTVTSVTFRIDLLMGGTGPNPKASAVEGITYTVTVDEDFGDAPAAYQASPVASHVVGGVYMGASVTADNTTTVNGNPQGTSPIANATASSDGGDDGVTFPILTRGVARTIDVAVTGTGGRLQGWIDWGADNSFTTAGDQIATNVIDGGAGDADGVANGIIRLNVTAPAGTTQVTTRARFRYSTTASLGINGAASDGEVEDYQVIVYPQRNDLSLAKTVSNPSPAPGSTLSYTLNLNSAALSTTSNTPTVVTVQDTLPAGFTFTSVASGGTGTYDSGTGIWTVGTLSPGSSASITINGTATGSASTTVTNIAQVRSSTITDPDSTPNNGVTTEDDYATVAFTTSAVFNCPTGNTSTGSGFATGGTGLYQDQIFWLDWACGGVTNYPAGSIINKSWDAGDGLVITGQVTNITFAMQQYITGTFGGDQLDNMYPGVNPIGLRGVTDGQDPQFRVVYSATLNGVSVPLNYVVADAESSDNDESLSGTTSGTNWTLLESQGVLTTTLTGNSFTMSDNAGAGVGSAIVSTTGSTVQIDATINQGGLQAMAFGVWTPFDFSDAPLTGTSYGSANHRTIGNYILGASVTTEAAAYNSPNASGDVDNGIVTTTNLIRGQASTIDVNVQGRGYLSGWIDFNDDGDWADAGEKIATDLRDGGAGDLDGAINGVIQFQVTSPLTAATTPTIARLRYSSRTSAPSSGLWGFGEVEDYEVTILNAELSLAKTSIVVSDPINGTNNPKRLPGATVRYCILTTNTGTVTAENIEAEDTLPTNVTFIPGTMRTGTTCAGAVDVEDANNTGADDSNPFGMSTDTYIVRGFAPTLAANGTFAMVFDVLVAPAPAP